MRTIIEAQNSGVGDGLAFYFFFALSGADEQYLAAEVEGIQDDALTLAENGYRVIIDQAANSNTFLSALYNEDQDLAGAETAGFLWSSHGDERGRVQTHDGRWFSCKLVVPERTSRYLRCAIFSACHVGAWEKHWKVSLPEVKIYGWGKPVSFDKAIEFYTPDEATTTGLDDILERELSLPEGAIAATYERLQGGEEFTVTTVSDDERTSAMADDSLGSLVNDALALLEYEVVEGPFQIDGNPHYNVVLRFGGGRKQRLDLLCGAGNPHTDRFDEDDDQYLYVQSIVGPMTGVIDPALTLGAASGMVMARVQVVEADPPQLMVQGALPDVTVLPETLAFLVEEVASLADNLEEQIFGCDED